MRKERSHSIYGTERVNAGMCCFSIRIEMKGERNERD